MDDMILYVDRLVQLSNKYLILKNYYFPSMKERKILLCDIARIEIKKNSIWNGKYRNHISAMFNTWFPSDNYRHKRDRIYIIIFPRKWFRIGFTVENTLVVEKIFTEKGLLRKHL
jgi:hypothetical protein